MPIEDKAKLTSEDMKTIIHGLKMSTLSFVEDDAIDNVKERIKNLPSPEKIDKLNPINLRALRIEIGLIMKLIDTYSRRDMEFKSRYKSRTGLPPRYKVMDFVRQQSTDIVREVIKISSCVDNDGRGELAGNLIKFARKIQNNEIEEKEWNDVIGELKKCGYSSIADSLEKKAQTPRLWSGLMKGIKEAPKAFMDPVRFGSTVRAINKSMESILYQINYSLDKIAGVENKISDRKINLQVSDFKNLMSKLKEAALGAKIQFRSIQKGMGSDANFDDLIASGEKYKVIQTNPQGYAKKIDFAGIIYDVNVDAEGSLYILSNGQKYDLTVDDSLQKSSVPVATPSQTPPIVPSASITPATTPSSYGTTTTTINNPPTPV